MNSSQMKCFNIITSISFCTTYINKMCFVYILQLSCRTSLRCTMSKQQHDYFSDEEMVCIVLDCVTTCLQKILVWSFKFHFACLRNISLNIWGSETLIHFIVLLKSTRKVCRDNSVLWTHFLYILVYNLAAWNFCVCVYIFSCILFNK